MTQGSNVYREQLLQISDRFARAIQRSFAFLVPLGFSACATEISDLDDLPSAIATHRYIREDEAIDIDVSLLTRQVSVVIFRFEGRASCRHNQPFASATELESWLLVHSRHALKRLPWMRKATLAEEMKPSINSFIAKMDANLESTVEWLAQRLQESGLLQSPHRC